ncbi:unnamed protein product [Sympodiomycopsis kandeliae]
MRIVRLPATMSPEGKKAAMGGMKLYQFNKWHYVSPAEPGKRYSTTLVSKELSNWSNTFSSATGFTAPFNMYSTA